MTDKPLFRQSALNAVVSKVWQASTEKASDKSTAKPATLVSLIPAVNDVFKANANENGGTSSVAPRPFIFGSSVADRVTNASTSSTGAFSFTALANQQSERTKDDDEAQTIVNGDALTTKERQLQESAAALAKERERYAISTVAEDEDLTTGEEDETRLCTMQCKLHQYNATTKQWMERGTGTLNINERIGEDNCEATRLVMRASVTHRLMLNSKLQPEITVERLGTKRVKFTAIDYESGRMSLFLITTNEGNADLLYKTIHGRVQRLALARATSGKETQSNEKTDEQATTKQKRPFEDSKKEETVGDDGTKKLKCDNKGDA